MKTSLTLLAGALLLSLTAEAKVDFQKEIAPIFQKSCLDCHGPDKQKGDLRLDNKAAALKGAKEGPVIVVGKPDESELYKRVILPKGHDDIMPPKGEPLTKEQTDLIKAWIAEGAEWPEGSAIKTDTVAALVAPAKPSRPAEYKPGAAELKAVAVLEAAGVPIRPIAQNSNWREANFRGLGTNATDAALAPLKDILGLVDLNLGSTKVTDAGLATIKGLTNLSALHLEHTGITDAGLAHVAGLTQLEYLNLFDTPLTDAGLKHLTNLKRLRNLFVWQTKVTSAGIEELKKALPQVNVIQGMDLTAKVEEKKDEKKAPEASKPEEKKPGKGGGKKKKP